MSDTQPTKGRTFYLLTGGATCEEYYVVGLFEAPSEFDPRAAVDAFVKEWPSQKRSRRFSPELFGEFCVERYGLREIHYEEIACRDSYSQIEYFARNEQ